MLKNIREKHAKRILWVLVIVIVPAFVLWGGSSILKGKRQKPLGMLDGRKIKPEEFQYYLDMAGLNHRMTALLSSNEEYKFPSSLDLSKEAWQYMLLLWKAKKENIEVTDEEVMERIRAMFSYQGKFNKDFYSRVLERGLKMPARMFEEYTRDMLKMDKLLDQNLQIQVTEDEIKNFFIKDTQKAKIDYIEIPIADFKERVSITEEEIKEFYNENKSLFKEAPTIKIKYTLIESDTPDRGKILESLADFKDIVELKDAFSLDIKETDFITLQDPLKDLGWQPQVNQLAFNLDEDQLSPPLEIDKGLIIIQKIDQKESFVPALDKITDKVKEKLIEKKALEKTTRSAQRILDEIKTKKVKYLRSIARTQSLGFKETGYFRYFDYIEGIGLDAKISEIIFSLKEGQIYLNPIILANGTYIIQLKEKTDFDEEDFKENKAKYAQALMLSKGMQERMEFIIQLAKEADLRISYPAQ